MSSLLHTTCLEANGFYVEHLLKPYKQLVLTSRRLNTFGFESFKWIYFNSIQFNSGFRGFLCAVSMFFVSLWVVCSGFLTQYKTCIWDKLDNSVWKVWVCIFSSVFVALWWAAHLFWVPCVFALWQFGEAPADPCKLVLCCTYYIKRTDI